MTLAIFFLGPIGSGELPGLAAIFVASCLGSLVIGWAAWRFRR